MLQASVIIPVYNGEKYIAIALASLVAQKQWLKEVIVVDNDSTDQTLKVAHRFDAMLPMRYTNVPEHLDKGPGNARQAGIDIAQGEWIGFIDVDDFLPFNALRIIDTALNELKGKDITPDYLVGNFIEYDYETDKFIKEHKRDNTWVHGKWYRKEFLDKNQIGFKENLYTHEDVYFNSCVLDVLNGNEVEFFFIDSPVYYWNHRNSESMTSQDRYVETNFADYACAVGEPHFKAIKQFKNRRDFFATTIVDHFLQLYFYYQAFLYTYKDTANPNSIEIIKNYYTQMIDCTNLTKEEILDYYNKNANKYIAQKQATMNAFGSFVESQSIADFLDMITSN